MITVSADAATALTQPERVIRPILSVDWDADGHGDDDTIDDLSPLISRLSRDQAWTSDLPEQVRLVEGNAVAQVTAALDGGDIVGPASSYAYRGTSTVANGAGYDDVYTLAIPTGTLPGDEVIIVVTVTNLHVTVTPLADLTPLRTVRLGSGTTGRRVLIYTHRARPTTDPYDPASDDVDASFAFQLSEAAALTAVAIAFGPTEPHTPGTRTIDAWDITVETVAGTVHSTPTIDVPDGTTLVSVFTDAAGASGSWTGPGGDTERADVCGAHASSNNTMAVYTSSVVTAGRYSRSATSTTSTASAAALIVGISPFPARDVHMHAAAYLSDSNLDSPLQPKRRVRRSVHYEVEIGTDSGAERIRRFTGLTRASSVSAKGRTAELSALDYRERMRTDLELPAVPAAWYSAETPAVLGLNATWLISYACYRSGVAVSPQPYTSPNRVQTVWAPLHGSLQSMYSGAVDGLDNLGYEGGYGATASGGLVSPTWIAGPYALAAYANGAPGTQAYGVVLLPTRVGITSIMGGSGSRRGRFECWVRGDALNAGYSAGGVVKEALYLKLDDIVDTDLVTFVGINVDRRLTLRVSDGGVDTIQLFGPTLPTDGAWHYVGISWDFDAGTKLVKFRCDSTDTSSNPSFSATFSGENSPYTIASALPIAEIHVSACIAAEPWLNEAAFTAEAVLDHSLLDLAGHSLTTSIEAWQLISDLARAEQAVAYWDEDGIFRYRTRTRLVSTAGQTVQVTLADDSRITDLDVDVDIDRVRNVVQVPWTTPEIKSGFDYIWQSTSPVRLPRPSVAGGITVARPVSIPIGWSAPPIAVDTSLVVQTATPPDPTDSYFIVNTQADGQGTNLTTDVTASISGWTTAGATLAVQSVHPTDVWLTEAAVIGYRMEDLPEVTSTVEDSNSIRRYTRQPLPISASPWLQLEAVAVQLGRLILSDTREPVGVITNLRIVGDPRLQLGDRVRIYDRYGAHLDGEYWITAIDESWDDGKYVMTIAARRAKTVARWGSARWGEAVWGSTA